MQKKCNSVCMISFFQVTDWVDPSFDDFSENTSISTITATSLGVNNSSHRRKNVPSTLESCRFPTRKRGKLSSSEEFYGLENSEEYLSENEPWVDKYKPETQVLNSMQMGCVISGRRELCIFRLLLIKIFLSKQFREKIIICRFFMFQGSDFLNSSSEVVSLVICLRLNLPST